LQKLVPLSLTNVLTLLEFLDQSSVFDILLRQVLKKVGKDLALLLVLIGVRDALHCELHVLLEVVKVLLFL